MKNDILNLIQGMSIGVLIADFYLIIFLLAKQF